MASIDQALAVDDDALVDWEVLPLDWWRIDPAEVSWTYSTSPGSRAQRHNANTTSARPATTSSRCKPLPVYSALLRTQASAVSCREGCGSEATLCPCTAASDLHADLVGVTVANDVLAAYEASVGIGLAKQTEDDIADLARRVVQLQSRWAPDSVPTTRAAWQSGVLAVLPDASFPHPQPPFERPDVLPPILDLDLDPPKRTFRNANAETSAAAAPSTPRPGARRVASAIKEQVDEVLRKFERLHSEQESGWGDDERDAKRVPPSPSSTSSSPATSDDSQSLASYASSPSAHRTRSSSLPSVHLRKDEHGFYNPVEGKGDDETDLEGREGGVRAKFPVNRLFQRTSDGWIRAIEPSAAHDTKIAGKFDPQHARASTPAARMPPPPTPLDDEDMWPSLTAPPPSQTRRSTDSNPQNKHQHKTSTGTEGWVESGSAPVATFTGQGQRKARSKSQQFFGPPVAVSGGMSLGPKPKPPASAPVPFGMPHPSVQAQQYFLAQQQQQAGYWPFQNVPPQPMQNGFVPMQMQMQVPYAPYGAPYGMASMPGYGQYAPGFRPGGGWL